MIGAGWVVLSIVGGASCACAVDAAESGRRVVARALSLFGVAAVSFGMVMCKAVDARQSSVDHGHAHYYLDDDNERQWEWLPPCAEEREQ